MSEFQTPRRGPVRPRHTIRAMMAVILLLGLVVAILTPLYRVGPPPCLTVVKTAVWLVSKPVSASCTDCH